MVECLILRIYFGLLSKTCNKSLNSFMGISNSFMTNSKYTELILSPDDVKKKPTKINIHVFYNKWFIIIKIAIRFNVMILINLI